MVHIDVNSSVADGGREPERDMTTRIRRMSADINRALAAAKPDATLVQLTNRVCRIIRRHGLEPNRATIRRRLAAQLAVRAELASAAVVTTDESPPPIPRQPVFSELPALETQPPAEPPPTFAPLPLLASDEA